MSDKYKQTVTLPRTDLEKLEKDADTVKDMRVQVETIRTATTTPIFPDILGREPIQTNLPFILRMRVDHLIPTYTTTQTMPAAIILLDDKGREIVTYKMDAATKSTY